MSQISELRNVGHDNSDDAKVIQLGFNISLEGKSASDFEIYVNDKKQECGELSGSGLKQIFPSPGEIEGPNMTRQSLDKSRENENLSDSNRMTEQNICTSASGEKSLIVADKSGDLTIIDELKNAMGNFEKFSDHLRDIPRLSTKKIYTSTPYQNKNNSRSEGNLSLYGQASRSYVPKHDFRDRKYFRKSKPVSSNLFLKPLPAEDYFKKSYVHRYYDVELYHHYASMDSLPQYYDYDFESKHNVKGASKSDNEKSDALSSASEVCISEVKSLKNKEKLESMDKQSSSSENAKDIKIFQSGGIIIMQNFNDNLDVLEKKDSLNGEKLIENCIKLTENIGSSFHGSDESQRLLINTSSDDSKDHLEKKRQTVQFDLSCENLKTKSSDSSSNFPKTDTPQTLEKIVPVKESVMCFSQNQENDSILQNLPGMSPTSSTSGKKLEWDSGADVGYLNADIQSENISTIERIILKGLRDNSISRNSVICQSNEQEPVLFAPQIFLEKMPSELAVGEIISVNLVPSKCDSDQNRANESQRRHQIICESNEARVNYKAKQEPSSEKNVENDTHASALNEKTATFKHRNKNLQCMDPTKNLKSFKSANGSEQKSQRKKDILGSKTNIAEASVQAKTQEKEKKSPVLSDKSTYVNTLFSERYFDIPLLDMSYSEESGRSESSEKSISHSIALQALKKLKKRGSNKGSLSSRLNEKSENIIDIARRSTAFNRPLELTHLNDATQPKQKELVHLKSDSSNLQTSANSNLNDGSGKCRPISASSSSVRTVLTSANPINISEGVEVLKHFSDQMIQTSGLPHESKGIQAFESAKCSTSSSQMDKEVKSTEITTVLSDVHNKDNNQDLKIHPSCSKSIQASGINSSLPRHLAHLKQTYSPERLNTKSTQFFGGPITSLPNYHSNAAIKEAEKVSNRRKQNESKVENDLIKERNMKNKTTAMQNDDSIHNSKIDGNRNHTRKTMKATFKNRNDPENKENFSVNEEDLSENSVKKTSCSRNESKDTYTDLKSQKSDSVIFGSCDVQLSDDGKSILLTSEILKEHGDDIDRDIIQEKYFQSQLNLGRYSVVSRNTYTEKKKPEQTIQTPSCNKSDPSVNCSNSPISSNQDKEICSLESFDSGRNKRNLWKDEISDIDDIRAHSKNKNSLESPENSEIDKDFALLDSSNGTQTAHSWERETDQNYHNQNIASNRALSFEYLPGLIYENVTNLSKKSVSDVAGSNKSDEMEDSQRGIKDADSGHTVVLENSDTSVGSNQMKNLDENLTELEIIVSRLQEKEVLFQKITDSILRTVSEANGSGDCEGREKYTSTNSQKTEEISCEIQICEEEKVYTGSNKKTFKKKHIEISTGCQTDDMSPDSSRFYEEKKKLEHRMNDEKRQQIEWIENEIKHLNMLRSLLETQEDSTNITQRRKRNRFLTEAKNDSSLDESLKTEMLKKIIADSLSKSPMALNNSPVEDLLKLKVLESSSLKKVSETEKDLHDSTSQSTPFVMSLSLSETENVQEITMLPVGVQLTLRDKKPSSNSVSPTSNKKCVSTSGDISKNETSVNQDESYKQTDVGTQYPSVSDRLSGSSVRSSDSLSRCKCLTCNKIKCMCLQSDTSFKKKISRSSSLQSKILEEEPVKESTINSANSSEESLKKNIQEINSTNSKIVSLVESSTTNSSCSRASLKRDQSPNSSHGSVPLEKCTCGCHLIPLMRCDICNLFYSCNHCRCYNRIKCCSCKNSTNKTQRKKCMNIGTLLRCKSDFCEMCKCSKLTKQVCSLCPCHIKPKREVYKSKKKFEERSCQTEAKECKCCECNDREKDRGLYRETKYMSEKEQVTEERSPSQISNPLEQKYETEERKSVDKKFPFEMKVALEEKKCTEVKNSTQIKNEIEKRSSSMTKPIEVKELKGRVSCRCKNTSIKKKSLEHPTHYFLKIEETTEEEESSESCDNGKSLEVITIKVPIRKFRKGGRNGSLSPQRRRNQKYHAENSNVYPRKTYVESDMNDTVNCNCDKCSGSSHEDFIKTPRPSVENSTSHRTQHDDNQGQCKAEDSCKCCADCPGFQASEWPNKQRPELSKNNDYTRRSSYMKAHEKKIDSLCKNCTAVNNYEPLNYHTDDCYYQEEGSILSGECHCCDDCIGKKDPQSQAQKYSIQPESTEHLSVAEFSSISESDKFGIDSKKNSCEKNIMENSRKGKEEKLLQCKKSSLRKPCQFPKSKNAKGDACEKVKRKHRPPDYYNFNKKEYMTKSELDREKNNRPPRLTLQECLTVKRPDLYTRAECRRIIISEKSRDRAERHNKRLECLTKLLPKCDFPANPDLKLFTSSQMRKQTRKVYKKLPEVTNKKAEDKKKMEFRTNKLMAEIFAKKLQLQTLKGCMNLSNSFSVMSTM